KLSYLNKLFDKLVLGECKSNSGDSGVEQIKTETIAPEKDYIKKFIGKPVDICWEEASKKGDPVGPDSEIDYENIFEDLSKLAEVEKQIQLLYRPFICVMDFSCRFNLYELGILMPDTRFDPGSHPSVSVRLHNIFAQVKIYAGGKMVATALSADAARSALFKVIRMVQEMDYKPDIKTFSKNIVHASFCMPFKIDVNLMAEQHAEQVTSNPKKRPFITYTTENAGVRFAIFPTGYVVVLHSSCHSETRTAIAALLPILAKVRNGYPKDGEVQETQASDVTYKLLWEKKLDEDKEGLLLYS
ncbi:hypothetical protein KR054_009457, partial [Drosophila jambulina]